MTRRTVAKILGGSFAALVVLAATVAVTLYVLGLRGLGELVLARFADEHRLESVTRLADGDLLLRGLHLRGTSWRVDARALRLRPDWTALARGEIAFTHAETAGMQVLVSTRSPGPSRELRVPTLRIDRLRVRDLALQVDDVQLRFIGLTGRFDAAGTDLHLRRASTDMFVLAEHVRLREVDLDAALTLPRQVHLRGRWQRLHASAPADGTLDVRGEPADLRGHAAVAAPLPIRGTVALRGGRLGALIPRLVLGTAVLEKLLVGMDFTRRPMPIQVRADATVPALGVLRIDGTSAWTGARMPISARVQAGTNTARLRGELDPSTWLARLALDAEDIDAAHWLDGATSSLRVAGTIGSHVLPPLHARVELRADGRLIAHAMKAEVAFELDGEGVALERAMLENLRNTLHVDRRGDRSTAAYDARWRLGDLSTLSTRLRGRLDGNGELQGRRIGFELDGRDLAIANERGARVAAITRVQARGTADLDRRIDVTADGTGLAFGNAAGVPRVERLRASLRGTPGDHGLEITATADAGELQAAMRGALRGTALADALWRGTLDRVALNTPEYGRWRLREPATASASAREARLGPLCVDGNDGASLCIDNARHTATGPAAGAYARVRIASIPLGLLPLARVEALRIEGRLNGELDVDPRRIAGSLHAEGTTAQLNRRRIAVETVKAQFSWPFAPAGSATLDAHLHSDAIGTLDAEVLRGPAGTLDGQLAGTLRDLGFLQALLTDTRQFYLEGNARVRLEIGGTAAAPSLGGAGDVKGRVRVPALGIGPMPLALALRGDGTRATFDGSLGGMAIAGALGLERLTQPTLDATVKGSRLRLVEQRDLVASLSPDLRVTMRRNPAGNVAEIGGSVTIDAADIRFSSTDARRGGLSDDVVIHPALDPRAPPARPAAPASPAFAWTADVQVLLGDAVRFTAAGLKTRLKGQLRVLARPPQPLRVLGFVDAVEGSLDTYGVRLNVERGRLDFNGPADNPRVDARATRNLDDTGGAGNGRDGKARDIVGVRISGPLQRMNSQLFSEPPRTAEETLALLVTGQSLAASSDTDLRAVGEAGLALGVLDALPVTSVLRDSLGLDELEVRNPLSRDAGEVRIGKQLTQRLRARYVYSVFNRTGGLQLRYRVTDRLSLQTETGATSNAIDVLWEWQSDSPARSPPPS